MKTYLVGGAVRDLLLGVPHKERDFVVVGGTPEEMLALGFKQVGKGFPVFLHPKTHEEYALARTERKTGHGYTGFTCFSSREVTLEEDLKRRDLTINAMALTDDGYLIDPYGGKEDLKNRILRHVSAAFAEDPLRVLRVARFAARFSDFTVHPETMLLMQNIVASGELNTLTPERVFQEFEKALKEKFLNRFFEILRECGALDVLFPEISWGQVFHHTFLVHMCDERPDPIIRFAALFSNLERESVRKICKRLRAPRAYIDLAFAVIGTKEDFQNALQLSPEHIVHLFEKLDAFRRKERFYDWLLACENFSTIIPSQEFTFLNHAYDIVRNVSTKPLLDKGINGLELKMALHRERVKALLEHSNTI